jgi:aspartate aminotransferase
MMDLMRNLGIVEINEQADQIHDCIRFDKGSSKFPFPEEFLSHIDSIKGQIRGNYFYYPATGGERVLKEQIVKVEATNNRSVSPNNTVITHGGMSGLFTIFDVLTKPHDEVIVSDYCFEGFSGLCTHFNLVLKRVNLSHAHEVEKAITSQTRVILVNSPENPTGKVYSKIELDNLLHIAEKHDLWLISDEVMHRIVYDGCAWYSCPMKSKKIIIVNSFSKTWFIPGIRVGWVATTDSDLASKFGHVLSLQSGGVNLFGQLFMAELLAKVNYEVLLQKRLQILSERKAFFETTLNRYKMTYLHQVQGGMNFYLNLQKNSKIITKKLLKKAGVAIIPGYLFEGRDSCYARVGFGAVTEKEIAEGIKRIASFTVE